MAHTAHKNDEFLTEHEEKGEALEKKAKELAEWIKESKLKEKRCGDIFNGNAGVCVYHDHMIGFLSDKCVNEFVFYDLKREKLVEVWDSRKNYKDSALLSVITSDSVNFIFLGFSGQKAVLIDKTSRKMIYKFSTTVDISHRNVFFDYSGKYSFGICGLTKINGKAGLNMFKLLPSGTFEIKHVDEELKSFYCEYSFGDDIFFGDNLFKSKGVIQYINKNEVKNIRYCDNSKFVIKNKGKDIFVLVKYKDKNKKAFGEVMYFMNRDLMLETDIDEIERVDYIRNMEDEKVDVLKISILNVIDFYCFKSTLLF